MFLNSINHFRALSILVIVASHVFFVTKPTYDSTYEIFIGNLLIGATIFFVFISGYLFHHVFFPRYIFRKFVTKKYINLLIPYLLLSLLHIWQLFSKFDEGWINEFYIPTDTNLIYGYIVPVLKFLMTGDHLIGYWYIPFILITFALSPLHVLFIKLDYRKQIVIFLMFFLISIVLQRPTAVPNPIHSTLYLTSAYLLGILFSQYNEKIYPALKNKEFYFLFVALYICWIQTDYEYVGNYSNSLYNFSYKGIDYNFIQKILLAIFFVIWLHRFENIKSSIIDKIAETSFAIYFLHPIVLAQTPVGIFSQTPGTMNTIITHLIYFFLLYFVSLSLAIIIKRLMPKKSKYLIGY